VTYSVNLWSHNRVGPDNPSAIPYVWGMFQEGV